jgi:ribosomal protein RSM22 (predicted rRNA methylase)
MALTHHVLVKVAAIQIGKTHFWDYFLLGDDLVIMDDGVAQSYRRLLRAFDMPISEAKTYESSEFFEFAKRWV